MSRTAAALSWALCGALLVGAGCRSQEARESSEAVAFVNGHPIPAEDLRREIELRRRNDPDFKPTPEAIREQIEVLVTRRLLIQEAQDRRLTEDQRFTRTIRTFWEQTLVRLLLERFHDEIQSLTPVTDADIDRYYAQMGYKATLQVLDAPTREQALAAAQTLREGGQVAWSQTIGPVRYDELRAEPLEETFALNPGEVKVFSHENGRNWVVRLSAKEADPAPPLEEVRPKIEALLRARNERRAFDRWLSEKRAAAKVELRPEHFEKVA